MGGGFKRDYFWHELNQSEIKEGLDDEKLKQLVIYNGVKDL